MIKTTLLPSLAAAATDRASCGLWEVHTRGNGKPLKTKCGATSFLGAWRNAEGDRRQAGLCSGNKLGPQLNDWNHPFCLSPGLWMVPFLGKPSAGVPETSHHATDTEEWCFSHC